MFSAGHIYATFSPHTFHRHDATALRTSTYKLDFGSIYFHGHHTNEQCVNVLGPGDKVFGSTAQEASI